MLIDPLVLKKKLNRMATEQGAFAVLSSLLLYVTELAAGDPQLSSKRTKWAEGKENKVSYNQPRPDPNRGRHPTRFQLLQSRFLNTNREPYTKKRREVGKLVIKEKLWVSRAGNKQDRCRDRKGDGKAAEEDAGTEASERARWNCAIRKNTVKNILQKFLAAEEKEAKEKTPTWKKKEPNSGLPKIVSKSSVLSKLKEQFEQSTVCSAAEVKASLSRKGERKVKNFPSRKTIRKPEVRMLRTTTMTATGINSPESQYLVCSTVPVPRLSIATKINHPWSWSKNNSMKQPFGNGTSLKEKGGSYREPGENVTVANTAWDREDKELPVAPEATAGAKDHAEAKIDSTNQGPNFNPNLDSYSTTSENKALADCILPLSEHSLDCDKDNIPAGPSTSSLLGITNAVQHMKEDSPPSILPYSHTPKRSHEQNPQDTKTGEVPKITMYVYSSEEADTEFTEPENDPFFAGQKCFPEQKALENVLSFHSPGVQASCEVEPPMEDRQLTLTLPTPASGKRPIIVQNKAPGIRSRCSEEAKEGVKCHSENKTSPTSTKNDNDVPTEKEEENKTPNSRMQNESNAKHPQSPEISTPQNNFCNSNVDIPNPDANQTKSTLSSNERQPGDAEEKHISSHLEKTQSPLPSDLVKHSALITEDDFGKDKLSSSNEIMYDVNNRALHRSNLTDLETCHKPSKSFIEREEATADEMPLPDSEACQSPLSAPLPTPMSGIAEQRIHHTLGNPTALPPNDLVRQGDEHASNNCEKHPPPSSDELENDGNDIMLEKKTACDLKNRVLPTNHATENENSMAEETNTCQIFENCLTLSTKKPGKHENKTTLARKPLLSSEKNRTRTSDDTTKQTSDMLEESLFPLSTELVSVQKKHVKSRNKVSKHTKDKLLSSDDDVKHDNDKMETKEREERNVLHKSEEEQAFTPRDTVDHHNNSSCENNAHRPQIPQLPPPEHDTNIQGVKNTGQGFKHLTPSKDFVKHRDDMTVDENSCYNNRKHHASSSNEPMKRANNSAGKKDIKSNFKNYSMPPRNTLRQNNKTTEEENAPHNLKNEPVQRKKSCEGERNTSCDPKNLIPLSNPLVKQDKKSPPLETEKQMSPGDFVKPETTLAKRTKQTSKKFESPSSKKVLKPQERSSSGEGRGKAPAAEDTMSPEPKAVKEDNEHHQLPPSRKSVKHEENTPGEDKQQTRCEDFTTLNKNAAKEKNKFPGSRKYQSVSSETSVKPQEKNTLGEKQISVSAGCKKPGTNAAKEKDEDPNVEKPPSSKKVMKSQEKNAPGDRKQKTPAIEDTRSPETKAVKEHDKHQCSPNRQLPTPSKPSKPEKNTLGGEKQQTLSQSFTKPDASAVKHKNKDPGSEMCQSPSLNSLVKSQEKKATAKKKQLLPPSDEKPTYKTSSPKEKSGPEKRQKYQVRSSAQSEKYNNDGSGKQGPVGDLKSYQTPLPSDGINGNSNTFPKETSSSNSEKSHKSSHVASKDEENPAGNRKKQSGFKKYQVHSSKNLVRHEKDVAEREGSWEAAGKTSEKKAELEECSKAASFPKYTVESYSERPLDSSFKPLIIRVTDTFKHHS